MSENEYIVSCVKHYRQDCSDCGVGMGEVSRLRASLEDANTIARAEVARTEKMEAERDAALDRLNRYAGILRKTDNTLRDEQDWKDRPGILGLLGSIRAALGGLG